MEIKGKLSLTRGSDDIIRINLKCAKSRILIAKTEMSLLDFAHMITGGYEQNVVIMHLTKTMKDVGKIRETRDEYVSRVDILENLSDYKEKQKIIIDDYVKTIEHDGWFVFSYGFSTKQPNKNKHHFIAARYVNDEDITGDEKS